MGCVSESNPSPHGGRGALPSDGGSPSYLLFLAGGGYLLRKEEAEDGPHHAAVCGRNCLRSCCLTGAKLPLYAFKNVNKVVSANKEPRVEYLSSLFLGEWEDRMQRGLFRYDVTSFETKVIPGTIGFIAQLNECRHLKRRPTEFCVDKVLQPFDENKFYFTKIGQEEVLFQFHLCQDTDAYFIPNAPVDTDNSPGVVAINVSPIEYGHVLLIPRILECLPQRIDRKSFLLALHSSMVLVTSILEIVNTYVNIVALFSVLPRNRNEKGVNDKRQRF
ncbi:Phosphate metabolism transcription protein [Castilleja foliolosa]|uniref:Phosphate metabolism transcription protein n=1 Tax=Castilleja foliolosa TaxID=1961234 RepID=A0ABD3EC99_9LAMI